MIMEGDPFALIEGMTIAGLAVGATKGYIYLRVEYPHAHRDAERTPSTIAYARAATSARTSRQRQGASTSRSRLGAGAYICGEETSMLESLEGKRGEMRYEPPLPGDQGSVRPADVVNNVISLATRADHPRRRAPSSTATSAWAGRAARCRSSSPATSSRAAWSRRRSA